MNKPDLTLFHSFARGGQKNIVQIGSKRCVIYTRVSTSRQMEGLSIEVQLKANSAYAENKGWEIAGLFGGTHESAKTDERKEFKRMLDFVKKHKVGWIVVYSLERFSRNENAIWLSSQLRKIGVEIVAATQPIDTSNPTGRLQQKVMFLFGEHDNELRRQKCVAGTKEHLLRGEWCNKPPLGFDVVKINGERKIVVNEKGKLLRKIFQWKADEGVSSVEIQERLTALGLKLSHQHISKILHNPFYCGLVVHDLLEGLVVEGQQEKLVSHNLFLRANDVLHQRFKQGYTVCKENDALPLKRFLHCECCGQPMTGYAVKKKQKKSGNYKMRTTVIHYYKCRTKGCKVNLSAKQFHTGFEQVLDVFTLDAGEDMQQLIREQMTTTYKELAETQTDERQLLEKSLKELDTRIERLEERYILEEIGKEMFDKYRIKYTEERKKIMDKYEEVKSKSSNLTVCIDYALALSSKLSSLYVSSDYTMKQKIQYTLFPKGITYDKKTGKCRTPKINSVMSEVARLAGVLAHKKRGKISIDSKFAPLVEVEGFEPPTLCL